MSIRTIGENVLQNREVENEMVYGDDDEKYKKMARILMNRGKRNSYDKPLPSGKSRDQDYYLDSIMNKLEDLHNSYVDMQRQLASFEDELTTIKKYLRTILRRQKK